MPTYKHKNFSRKSPLDVGGKKVGRPKHAEEEGLGNKYKYCNLTNREPPSDSKVKWGSTALVEYEEHLDTDTVEIVGVTTINVKRYFNIIHGRWIGGPENENNVVLDPVNRHVDGVYEYYNTPSQDECKAPDPEE